MASVSFLEANLFLEKYKNGFLVSERDGFVIVKAEIEGKTVMLWFRQSPITETALKLFKRIVGKHKYDELWLVRLYNHADYVKFEDLKIFDKVVSRI